jgi:hypothetical protein
VRLDSRHEALVAVVARLPRPGSECLMMLLADRRCPIALLLRSAANARKTHSSTVRDAGVVRGASCTQPGEPASIVLRVRTPDPLVGLSPEIVDRHDRRAHAGVVILVLIVACMVHVKVLQNASLETGGGLL